MIDWGDDCDSVVSLCKSWSCWMGDRVGGSWAETRARTFRYSIRLNFRNLGAAGLRSKNGDIIFAKANGVIGSNL